MKKTSRTLVCAAALMGLAMFASTSSFAGFEMLGSKPAKTSAPEAADHESEPGVPIPDLAPVPDVESTPVTSPVADKAEVVEGFGSDMNIVMALRQIVPSNYQISFAQGLNLEDTVSWQGGKPWDDVVHETLASKGLVMQLKDNVVVVEKGAPAAIAAAPVPTPEPEQQPQHQDAELDAAPVMLATTQPPAPVEAPLAPAPTPESLPEPSVNPDLLPAPIPLAAPPSEDIVAPVMAQVQPQPEFLQPQPWQVSKGALLHDVLKTWSERAGVTLYWLTDYDLRLSKTQSFGGTYEQAVADLLGQFSGIVKRPYGKLHRGGDGGNVLVIKFYDSE